MASIRGIRVQRLLSKLEVISSYVPWIDRLELHNLVGDEESGKHGRQEISILNHLRRIRAFSDAKSRSIELGAGTARLSDRLQRTTSASFDHILVDRFEFEEKQCRDRFLRGRARRSNVAAEVRRVVQDIALLDLNKYCSPERSAFVMSKHLY